MVKLSPSLIDFCVGLEELDGQSSVEIPQH